MNKMFTNKFGVLGSTIAVNRKPHFVPGGSAMLILVPWKPVALVWGLLSGMILVGFVASSLLEGKNPFEPGATITQPPAVKRGVAQAGQQPKDSPQSGSDCESVRLSGISVCADSPA
jgi:hypothetical protein